MTESLAPDTAIDSAAPWQRLRRQPRPGDDALSEAARHWLRDLPPGRRPTRLCRAHPRLVNRIAWVWRDTEMTAQVLDDLTLDRRGGRRGFAAVVQRELHRLREFNDAQRVPTVGPRAWDRVGLMAAG